MEARDGKHGNHSNARPVPRHGFGPPRYRPHRRAYIAYCRCGRIVESQCPDDALARIHAHEFGEAGHG